MKLKQRNLKVLLSVGGWTYSQNGHFGFVTDAGKRARFVSDAVKLVEDYGFDGIDIDFEYPSNAAQGDGLASLLSELRTALDNLAKQKGDTTPYLVTVSRLLWFWKNHALTSGALSHRLPLPQVLPTMPTTRSRR